MWKCVDLSWYLTYTMLFLDYVKFVIICFMVELFMNILNYDMGSINWYYVVEINIYVIKVIICRFMIYGCLRYPTSTHPPVILIDSWDLWKMYVHDMNMIWAPWTWIWTPRTRIRDYWIEYKYDMIWVLWMRIRDRWIEYDIFSAWVMMFSTKYDFFQVLVWCKNDWFVMNIPVIKLCIHANMIDKWWLTNITVRMIYELYMQE